MDYQQLVHIGISLGYGGGIAHNECDRVIRELYAEVRRLRDLRLAEDEEFDAGYDCAEAGGSLIDNPRGADYNMWSAGFKVARYDRLVKTFKGVIHDGDSGGD